VLGLVVHQSSIAKNGIALVACAAVSESIQHVT
jgi:hypothetical protein